ncbi:MAG: hypothetical protein CMJ19_16875 [Phycisphaeraceae bacterium]|nr:hypothetical protein [Phycisphaeraceae bacterium]
MEDQTCDGALPQTPPTGSRWIAAPGSGVNQVIQNIISQHVNRTMYMPSVLVFKQVSEKPFHPW